MLLCDIALSETDRGSLIAEVERLVAVFGEQAKDPAARHGEIWDTYLREFDRGDIDGFVFEAIYEKLTCEEERTDEESAVWQQHRETCFADARRRVGRKVCSYQVVIRARRLFRLMALDAPAIIRDYEARCFATAMALHKYASAITPIKA